MKKYDIIIIGAGITGCFIAYLLSKTNQKVAVLEKDNDVANGCTNANSAIVHSGHDPEKGTLKAKFNVIGNKLYRKYAKELDFPIKDCGAYVVAKNADEEKIIQKLILNCKERNINFELLDGVTLRKREPNANEEITMAIWLPTTAVISPWKTCFALMNAAIKNGVELFENSKVEAIKKEDVFFSITTNKQTFLADKIINCAGLHGDEIARMFEPDFPYHIEPRIGEYYVLDKSESNIVNSIIYPVPSAKGKGILAIPTVDGNLLLGPTSEPFEDKENFVTTPEGLENIKRQVKTLVNNLNFSKVIRVFSGIRPCSDTKDFIIEPSPKDSSFINVIGIDSPGLASAPAIAEYVVEHLLKLKIIDTDKNVMDKNKQSLSVPPEKYSHIVCRCEQISEGEVIEAILREPRATSIKAVKKRVRAGMGRCQGGFCEPEVARIISETLGIPLEKVVYDGPDSKLFVQNNR